MNKGKNLEDLRLRRNGEGYWDPTAYEAIKRADAEMEGRKHPKKKKKEQPAKVGYGDPYEKGRGMTIKQYIRWKLKVLNELGVNPTDEDKARMSLMTSEYEIDAYAHKLIMKGD